MTQAQLEHLREAIACRDIEHGDLVASMQHAAQTLMQALDYEDWNAAHDNAAFIADVLRTLARR